MKKISLLIVLCMILSVFASCGNENPGQTPDGAQDNPGIDSPGSSDNPQSPEEPTTSGVINSADALPEADYEGRTFTILGREYPKLGNLPEYEFVVEAENGDIINDTIYKRNRIVEENFNVEIKAVQGDGTQLVPKAVKAGDGTYDLVWQHVNTMSSLALSGNIMNYYDVPNIDLKKPWWNQLAAESLTLNGKCYLQMNYIPFTGVMLSHCVFVNKRLIQDYELENPYELVDKNEWVYDKFSEMAKSVLNDLDGNSVYDGKDLYGLLASHGTSGMAMAMSMGASAVDVKSDGTYEFILANEKNASILEKLVALTSSQNTYLITDYAKENDLAKMFANGQGLFYAGFLTDAYQFFRNMDDDFGLLPRPKYDSSQEHYRTSVTGGTGLLGVMVGAEDPEFTGLITEALAIESYNYVYPAVFDVVMSTKLLRDEDSLRMYDILMNGMNIDFSRTFKYSEYVDIIDSLVSKGSTDLVSAAEKAENGAKKYYDGVIELFFED